MATDGEDNAGTEGSVDTSEQINRWAEAIAGAARTGLAFTESRFEQERYEEILAVAADMRAALGDEPNNAEQIARSWMDSIATGILGYATPKIAIGAVVADSSERILLIQRADSGVWLYPTGWADIGYSASEVAVKEVKEETGVSCSVERPLAIFDGLRGGFSRVPLYSIVFFCRYQSGQLVPHPAECTDVGWFGRDELPKPLAGSHLWVDAAFRAAAGEVEPVRFDQPREPVWRHHLDGDQSS